MVTRAQLLQIAPLMGGAKADLHAPPLTIAMAKFGITSNIQQAHFLGQVVVESDNFKSMSENLNYKPESLIATFNRPGKVRFTSEQAQQYGRTDQHPANQRMIAILAYGNRMGNRPNTEDGWRYRGRGDIMLTGLDNYKAFAVATGVDAVGSPELLEQPDEAALAAAWFWSAGNSTGRSLNRLVGDVHAISLVVNAGENSLAERIAATTRALKAIV